MLFRSHPADVVILAGGMLAFALSFDEIIVTTFTAGHERTLPLWLLNQLGRPRDVQVTFRDPDSARMACMDPYPVILGLPVF